MNNQVSDIVSELKKTLFFVTNFYKIITIMAIVLYFLVDTISFLNTSQFKEIIVVALSIPALIVVFFIEVKIYNIINRYKTNE